MKKLLVIFIAIFAFGSLGGVFLAGLNMYTRSTTPKAVEQTQEMSQSNTVISNSNTEQH